jgi:hypothetical protein
MRGNKKSKLEFNENLTEKNRFIIYCVPRTGSYHLAGLLDSAPDIVCHGELFKNNKIELKKYYRDKINPITKTQRDKHPWTFINSIRNIDKDKHFGFKLFHAHAKRVDRLQRILGGPHWKKIALIRDPIEVYASLLRAQATQRWTKRRNVADSSVDDTVAVHFDRQSFERFANNYLPYLRKVLQFTDHPNWLIVPYGELNNADMQRVILRFLGSRASPAEISSDFEKQYDGPISEAFDNWGELIDFMDVNNPFRRLNLGGHARVSRED